MSQVLNGIGSLLPDPRKLFAVAAVLGALAVLLGYIEYHDRADRDLALQQDAPAAVALQNFNPSLHTGPADEVMIHAEAGFGQAIVLTVPGSDPAERALVAPLYPLSEMGQALIDAQSDGSKTALTAQVARRTGESAAGRPAAIGLFYHPLAVGEPAPDAPAALAALTFGDGLNGSVVALNGWIGEPGDLGYMAAGAFAAGDTTLAAGFLTIQPFAEDRFAALSALRDSGLYLVPAIFALMFVLIGIVAAMHGRRDDLADPGYDDDLADLAADGLEAHAAHPKFAPIPSQREIVEAAAARVPEEPNWFVYWGAVLLRGMLAGLRMLGGAVLYCGRALRNRLSRPEDEAL